MRRGCCVVSVLAWLAVYRPFLGPSERCRRHGWDGYWLRCVYYSATSIRLNWTVHWECHCAPLFDDRWRRKATIRNHFPRSRFFSRLQWAVADDPDLRRVDLRRVGARLHLHRLGTRPWHRYRACCSCRFSSTDCLLRRRIARRVHVRRIRRLERFTSLTSSYKC